MLLERVLSRKTVFLEAENLSVLGYSVVMHSKIIVLSATPHGFPTSDHVPGRPRVVRSPSVLGSCVHHSRKLQILFARTAAYCWMLSTVEVHQSEGKCEFIEFNCGYKQFSSTLCATRSHIEFPKLIDVP